MLTSPASSELLFDARLASEEATVELATRLAAVANKGDVIALVGDFGTGKTTFVRAFVRASVNDYEEVPSPTFTLVQTYYPRVPGRPAIWHFDLFRLLDSADATELAIDEAFAYGISLIEWPERLGARLPPHHLRLDLSIEGPAGERRLMIRGNAEWRKRLREIGLV